MNIRIHNALSLTALLMTPLAPLHSAETIPPYATIKYDPASPEKMQWWEDAKFGLFIHWGPYSVPGGIWSKDNTFKSRFEGSKDDQVEVKGYAEQILKNAQMPLSEYEKIFEIFDWSKFNAQDYINLCFASGQRYIVITSKHHDGFAMWRSKVHPWNIGDATPYGRQSGRDPLKELADACHATKTNGSPWEIKMCFYHSHCVDWHEDDAAPHGYEIRKNPTTEQLQAYFDRKVFPQVTELLTNYGEIGVMWFDVPRLLTVAQAQQFKDLVNTLSPNTIIDGRLGQDMGNYVNTGDNGTVGAPVNVPWETGSSLNESYGYKINPQEYLNPDEIIHKMIEVVSHGGNYLLNIGPKGDGTITAKDREILTEVGKWTKANGAAIFGTRRTPFFADKAFAPDWGHCTQKGNTLYLLVTRWPANGKVVVPLLQNKVRKACFLADPDQKPLPCDRSKDHNGNDTLVISVPHAPLDKVATVIAVECEGDQLKLAPFRHAYDPAKKQIFLSPANFQIYASNIKSMNAYYDPEQQAVVNWRFNKGGGPTLVWTYEVPEAGQYELEVDYALNKRYAGLPVNVLVDHLKQLTFTTQDTGGETVSKRISVGTVKLEKGRQDIAFELAKSKEDKLFVMQLLRGIHLTRK